MRVGYGTRFIAALLCVAIAGCGDDSPTKYTIAGTADVTVAGEVNTSVDATALYVVSGVPSTTLTLAAGTVTTPTHKIILTRFGARPATGTYAIGGELGNFMGTFVFEGGSAPDRTFVLTTGTVNITASSEGSLRGTIVSATALEGVGPATTEVTISGAFTARCLTASSDC